MLDDMIRFREKMAIQDDEHTRAMLGEGFSAMTTLLLITMSLVGSTAFAVFCLPV
jgi:hypothetical protein